MPERYILPRLSPRAQPQEQRLVDAQSQSSLRKYLKQKEVLNSFGADGRQHLADPETALSREDRLDLAPIIYHGKHNHSDSTLRAGHPNLLRLIFIGTIAPIPYFHPTSLHVDQLSLGAVLRSYHSFKVSPLPGS
jgi:hypothetical protein